MDPTYLFVSLVVGAVGMAMLTFGKKAGRPAPLACGLGLMVLSYVMPTATTLLVSSAIVAAVPLVVKT